MELFVIQSFFGFRGDNGCIFIQLFHTRTWWAHIFLIQARLCSQESKTISGKANDFAIFRFVLLDFKL